MTYIPQPIDNEGGKRQVVVADENSRQLLDNILRQLKIMNTHLENISDEHIRDQEIE